MGKGIGVAAMWAAIATLGYFEVHAVVVGVIGLCAVLVTAGILA